MTETKQWDRYEHFIFNRVVEGVISVCLSNRLFPVIKSVRGSNICSMIAHKVYEFYDNNYDFIRKECSRDINGLLFIFDRKEDPVTPLLNQWTYQAMIHELIGITNNIMEIKHGDNTKSDKYVLSDVDDKFFSNNLNGDFGDVASKVKELVEDMNKEQERYDKKVDTLEDIKKMVEKLPEKKKESQEITKHTNIIYELMELMQSRELMKLSELEQEMACSDNKSSHFSRTSAILKNKEFNSLDKAKLFLLYCLRYEGDNTVHSLKNIMEENNMKEWIEYLDYLLLYAGKSKRVMDVFNNKDFITKSKSKLVQAFKNIPNMYTQHSSYMPSILEKILKGKENTKEIDTILFPNQKEK